MGYAYGTKWNDVLIEKGITDVMNKARIKTFPTHKQMYEVTGSMALTNAVSKHGGTRYWAEKLGLEIKPSESKFGEEFELKTMEYIKHMGYLCKKTPVRYPYDILVENNIKVDVKCSNLYQGKNGEYYTFNLEKSMPTCDLFVCFCLTDELPKIYVIPSIVLSGNTQLSIGKNTSKYDKYLDQWVYFRRYDEFYQKVMEGAKQ
jgi:hypothetical protein